MNSGKCYIENSHPTCRCRSRYYGTKCEKQRKLENGNVQSLSMNRTQFYIFSSNSNCSVLWSSFRHRFRTGWLNSYGKAKLWHPFGVDKENLAYIWFIVSFIQNSIFANRYQGRHRLDLSSLAPKQARKLIWPLERTTNWQKWLTKPKKTI